MYVPIPMYSCVLRINYTNSDICILHTLMYQIDLCYTDSECECEWVKTECTQTAHKTQIKNLNVKKRRTNLQILEYKKYLCNPPPPRTNICTLHKHYTNTTQNKYSKTQKNKAIIRLYSSNYKLIYMSMVCVLAVFTFCLYNYLYPYTKCVVRFVYIPFSPSVTCTNAYRRVTYLPY